MNDVLLGQATNAFVTVDEAAGIAVFLRTDTGKEITGVNLDGGWTAA